jgi:hypothetical protein
MGINRTSGVMWKRPAPGEVGLKDWALGLRMLGRRTMSLQARSRQKPRREERASYV